MPTQPETPKSQDTKESSAAKAQKQEQMKRIADKAAGKARQREKTHDLQRGPFPRSGPSGMA